MNRLMKRACLSGTLVALAICSSGCMQVASVKAHDSTVKKFPTYAETKETWGNIAEGQGRLVVFYPRVSTAKTIVSGSFGGNPLGIKIDKNIGPTMQDQAFVFIDLAPGKHSIGIRGLILGPKPREFDILPGEITYLRLTNRMTDDGLLVMTSQEAEPLLAETYHLFRMPLPCDKQDKSAERIK